jgi:hypothetical protein
MAGLSGYQPRAVSEEGPYQPSDDQFSDEDVEM